MNPSTKPNQKVGDNLTVSTMKLLSSGHPYCGRGAPDAQRS